MVGQQLEVAVRHGLLVGAHRVGQLRRLLLERRVVGGVVGRALRVELRQLVADDRRVLDRIQRVGPQVGVGLAALLREGEVVDVVRLGQHRRADLHDARVGLLVLLREVEGRILELQAVDEDQVGLAQQLRDLRGGLEGVAVRALRHDALHLHPVAADGRRDRRDGRHRRGDQRLVGRARRTSRGSARRAGGQPDDGDDRGKGHNSAHEPTLRSGLFFCKSFAGALPPPQGGRSEETHDPVPR